MPLYNYKGYDAVTGAQKKGSVDADSPKSARQKLRQKDKIIVSELKEQSGGNSKTGQPSGPAFLQKKVSSMDIAIMTRQFATLQSAHVPIDESLKALTSQVDNPRLRGVLSQVRDDVGEGKSLGDSMQNHPAVFDRLYVNMVRAGESSGALGLVMERLSGFIEYQVKIRGQIMSAMMYPIVMMLATSAITAFLFVSVVPKLQKVFVSLKVKLPWYTEALIGFSEFLQNRWYVIIIVAVVAFFSARYWVGTPKGRRKFDGWVLKAPIFGPIVMRINVSRFTRTLSTLLSSGVPIIRALEITRNIISNVLIGDALEQAKIAVQEGQSLGATIERSGQFPPLVTHMIMTGERTGQLEEMLGHVAVAYDAEVERKVDGMISLIEPIMVIMMTGGAGGILGALMVPMLGIMNQMR